MQPSVPERPAGQTPSTTDLPYGPLPVRLDQAITAEPTAPRPGRPPSGLEPEAADHRSIGEQPLEPSSELELMTPSGDDDDDVHFGVAARALGVSRRTVERMVKRGLLDRGPSGAPATVAKRSLVTVLEQRRRDVSHLTRATEVQRAQSAYESLTAPVAVDASAELQELLRPMLGPLLDEFVAARTRAAVLESQVESMRARAAKERARDELMVVLATGGWRQRRQARRMALRLYVLGEDPSGTRDSSDRERVDGVHGDRLT
jgi:hypothetical protein